MIEINLLPEELRSKVARPDRPVSAGGPVKRGVKLLTLIISLGLALLVVTHIFIVFLDMGRSMRLNALKGKWEKALPQRKALEEFNTGHSLLLGDSQSMQRLLTERIIWSEKLNRISLSLPEGVWLEYLSVSGKEFYLRGKAVSAEKKEVSLIRDFIDEIKGKPGFIKNFNSLELTSIQKGVIGAYEVADFSLTGSLR